MKIGYLVLSVTFTSVPIFATLSTNLASSARLKLFGSPAFGAGANGTLAVWDRGLH